ncbi:MAG: hypothetical protein MJH10_10745 [Epibacterium sp.]|jgi:hypothetical protein|nr:hypothetical protein [Epibacterium sp.]NQX74020.1 hypothetical protein [Epibacterium sp.]
MREDWFRGSIKAADLLADRRVDYVQFCIRARHISDDRNHSKRAER